MKTDVEPTSPGTRKRREPRLRSLVRRHRRSAVTAALLAVGLIVFVVVWFEPQKAFLDSTVQEALPGTVAPASPIPGGSTPTSGGEADTPTPAAGENAVLAFGEFTSLEHETTGRALLVRVADGRVFLRFEDLDTLNGPDLRVYLSEVPAGGDAHAYGERFVDLGALKGNRGNQNYLVPKNVDLTRFKSAVIWCRRFAVGFGVAPLSAG